MENDCECCEEKPGKFVITLTDCDSVVLGTELVCEDCIKGFTVDSWIPQEKRA